MTNGHRLDGGKTVKMLTQLTLLKKGISGAYFGAKSRGTKMSQKKGLATLLSRALAPLLAGAWFSQQAITGSLHLRGVSNPAKRGKGKGHLV